MLRGASLSKQHIVLIRVMAHKPAGFATVCCHAVMAALTMATHAWTKLHTELWS